MRLGRPRQHSQPQGRASHPDGDRGQGGASTARPSKTTAHETPDSGPRTQGERPQHTCKEHRGQGRHAGPGPTHPGSRRSCPASRGPPPGSHGPRLGLPHATPAPPPPAAFCGRPSRPRLFPLPTVHRPLSKQQPAFPWRDRPLQPPFPGLRFQVGLSLLPRSPGLSQSARCTPRTQSSSQGQAPPR